MPAEIAALIRDEQAKQEGGFVPDEDAYLAKLASRAELVVHYEGQEIRGFAFFYCNDPDRRFSFVTLIMVRPEARGQGIGRALLDFVFSSSRQRGFRECRLEVAQSNEAAKSLYSKSGFEVLSETGEKQLMAVQIR